MYVKALPIKVLGPNGGSTDSILNGLKYAGGEENSSGVSYSSSQFPVAAVNMSWEVAIHPNMSAMKYPTSLLELEYL